MSGRTIRPAVVTIRTQPATPSRFGGEDAVVTWTQTIAAFDAHLAAGGRSPQTRELRRYHLYALADHVGAEPGRVSAADVESWLSNPRWSQNTRRSARSSAVGFFRWCQRSGVRGDDPTADILPVPGVTGKPRPCPEQAMRLALMAGDERARLAIMLAAGVGLRRAEIAAVRGKDVEDTLDGPVLRVVGKGGRERLLPIDADLAARLRARQGWVFPSPSGGHLTPAHLGKIVSRLLPQGWTTHTLRHRFASVAYRADRDLRAVQDLLGHADVRTTQIYTAIPDDARRRACSAAAVAA